MNKIDFDIARTVNMKISPFFMVGKRDPFFNTIHADRVDAGVMSRLSGAVSSSNLDHYPGCRAYGFERGITYRGYEIHAGEYHTFEYIHPDYDGAPDSFDTRLGWGATVEECMLLIDDEIEEEG